MSEPFVHGVREHDVGTTAVPVCMMNDVVARAVALGHDGSEG